MSESSPTEGSERNSLRNFRELAALVVFAIPAVGYFGELLSLMLNPKIGMYDVFTLALDRSVPFLAVVGTFSLAIAGLPIAVLFVATKIASRIRLRNKPIVMKRVLWVCVSGEILLLVFLGLFQNIDFAVFYVIEIGLLIGSFFLVDREAPFSLKNLWAPLTVVIVSSAVLVGRDCCRFS